MTRTERYMAIMAGALCASAFTAGPVSATPASGFSAAQQFKGVFDELDVKGEKAGKWDVKLTTKDVSDVWVVRNSIAAGGQSGWHRHPGPSLITVTIGEIT